MLQAFSVRVEIGFVPVFLLFGDFARLLEAGEGALEERAEASFLSFLTGERGFFVLESFVGEEGMWIGSRGAAGLGADSGDVTVWAH